MRKSHRQMNRTFLSDGPLLNRNQNDEAEKAVQQSPRTYVEPGASIAQTAQQTKFWAEG